MKLFKCLGSKKVFDPFAGWGNSVIACKELDIEIDAIDKDKNLKERYDFLREYKPSKVNLELLLNLEGAKKK